MNHYGQIQLDLVLKSGGSKPPPYKVGWSEIYNDIRNNDTVRLCNESQNVGTSCAN